MGKFVGLLSFALRRRAGSGDPAALFMGSSFGYGVFVIAAAIPFAYIPVLLVGLPVVGSAIELPYWRSALVGMLCAVPAGFVFLNRQFFSDHVLSVCFTFGAWLVAGAVIGGAMVYRRGAGANASKEVVRHGCSMPSAAPRFFVRRSTPTLGRTMPQLHIDPGSPWFLPWFAGLWLLVSCLLAFLSGWRSLAAHFRTTVPISGEKFRFVSGALGLSAFPVSYGGCLFVTVSEQGVGLSILFLFRLLSPPLLIPWTEINAVRSGRFLFRRFARVRFRRVWPELRIYGPAAEHIALAAHAKGVADAT